MRCARARPKEPSAPRARPVRLTAARPPAQPQRVFAGKWRINSAKGEAEAVSQPLLCGEKDRHMMLTTAAAEELLHMQSLGNFWARNRFLLDITGSVIIFLGVNFYNVMVVAEFWRLTPDQTEEYVTLPCNLGGLGFVLGSYLLWAGCTESWVGTWAGDDRTVTWCVATARARARRARRRPPAPPTAHRFPISG